MYEQYKFKKMKELLLYLVARNTKPMKVQKILGILSEFKENTIYNNLTKLHNDKLIKKSGNLKYPDTEISLNVKWQRKLIRSLINLTRESPVQFIFATHSMELLTQYRNNVLRLNNIK